MKTTQQTLTTFLGAAALSVGLALSGPLSVQGLAKEKDFKKEAKKDLKEAKSDKDQAHKDKKMAVFQFQNAKTEKEKMAALNRAKEANKDIREARDDIKRAEKEIKNPVITRKEAKKDLGEARKDEAEARADLARAQNDLKKAGNNGFAKLQAQKKINESLKDIKEAKSDQKDSARLVKKLDTGTVYNVYADRGYATKQKVEQVMLRNGKGRQWVEKGREKFTHRVPMLMDRGRYHNSTWSNCTTEYSGYRRHGLFGNMNGYTPVYSIHNHFSHPSVAWAYQNDLDDDFGVSFYGSSYWGSVELRRPFSRAGVFFPTQALQDMLVTTDSLDIRDQVTVRRGLENLVRTLDRRLEQKLGYSIRLDSDDIVITNFDMLRAGLVIEGFASHNGRSIPFKALIDLDNDDLILFSPSSRSVLTIDLDDLRILNDRIRVLGGVVIIN